MTCNDASAKPRSLASLAFALAAALSAPAVAGGPPPRVTLNVLAPLGGDRSFANAINDAGQVVGSTSTATGLSAYLWDAVGGMREIPGTAAGGVANGINQRGQVVGSSVVAGQTRAFVWEVATGLRTLDSPVGAGSVTATAINNSGSIVGFTSNGAVSWPGGGAVQVLSSASSSAGDIDSLGRVVGYDTVNGLTVAQRWLPDGTRQSLGTAAGYNKSSASASNDAGQVVGWSGNTGPVAMIWDEAGGMRSLGHLGGGQSGANAINSAGQVVGYSRMANGSNSAILWREGAGMSDLGPLLGPALSGTQFSGINQHAQIVGTGTNAALQSRGFLLTLHPDWAGGDGAWDDSSGQRWNWAGTGTAAARVGAMHDVVIDPGRSATVLGSAQGSARSLRIGGTAGHIVTLDLNGGTTRLDDGQAGVFTTSVIGAGGVLRGSGRLEVTDTLQVRAGGRVEAGAGQRLQLSAAYLDNQGLIRAQGTAFQQAVLEVSGGAFFNAFYNQAGAQLQLVQADAVLASGLVNFGQVSLQNAQMTLPQNPQQGELLNVAGASLAFSFGSSLVNGKISNQGLLVVSNGAQASFHGAVVNGGELRVSSGGAANFFGLVSGAGAFTGAGQVRFEGGLSVGNSPAAVQIDPETAITSVVTMELGGTSPGDGDTHHDQISFTRGVTLEGATLSVQWWAGHEAAEGAVYDLFDWNGGVSGSFATVNLPTLGAGLAWNTADLYAGGTLRVTAVPEPQAWALFGSGLVLLSWLARRRRPAGLAA